MPKKVKRGRGRPRLLPDFPPPRKFTGEDVRELRRAIGKRAGFKKELSLADFADVLGVDKSVVHSWQCDRKPPSGAARRLMEILDAVPEAAPALILKGGSWRRRMARKTRKGRANK